MKKILLPNGLKVSPIALGAMTYGTSTPKADAFRALDAFVDAPLLGGVPDRPIRRAHRIRTASRRQSALRCSARRCNGGKGTGERNESHPDSPKHFVSD